MLCFGQQYELFLCAETTEEQLIVDQIPFKNQHISIDLCHQEAVDFLKKIHLKGYLSAITTRDSISEKQLFKTVSLGKNHPYLRLTRPESMFWNDTQVEKIFPQKTETIPTIDFPKFMKSKTELMDAFGYGFAELEINTISLNNDTIVAHLTISDSEKRKISRLKIRGYDKFPPNYLRALTRKHTNRIFSQKAIQKIDNELQNVSFINVTKFPELLFLKDSTEVYLYVSKNRSNKFDGYIGVTSDDNGNTTFNGYLDLELINSFNRGEKLALYWKNNGENRKTFRGFLELPYIFKTPFGIKSSLEIFTETEQFQSTTINSNVGYLINFNTKLYVGYETNQSTTIQTLINSIQSFKSVFYTSSFEFNNKLEKRPDLSDYNILVNLGLGNRKSGTVSSQEKLLFIVEKNFFLHPKHIFNCKTENFILVSADFLKNELYRFGGIKSIRGFNENTLQANQVHNLMTEYRFYFAPKNYMHTIIDYGYANDKTINKYTTFKSFGLGIGLATKTGLLQLIYANGTVDKQAINISNSIVHVGYKSYF